MFANRTVIMSVRTMNPDKENDPCNCWLVPAVNVTDDLFVYVHPEPSDQGKLALFFLSNDLRYLHPTSLQRIAFANG